MILQLLRPVPDVSKGPQIGDVENQNESHRVSIKRRGQRPKALLARGVPQLEEDISGFVGQMLIVALVVCFIAVVFVVTTTVFVIVTVIIVEIGMELDDLLAKVDADCGYEVGGEVVVDEPLQHRSLSDSGVSER